jgi:hypothetical protein
LNDQRLYLVLNATFSDIVIKYFIWCWTLLSVISWSTILLGVERHFQLYRGFVVCVCCCPLILITPLVFSNSSSVWSVFKIRSNNVRLDTSSLKYACQSFIWIIKDCIWCWTLLSVISRSTILFGVERYFQLYRGGGNYRPNAKSLTNVFQRFFSFIFN